MTPIDIQISRSKVRVEGQAYSLYVWEGGISVSQTSIFYYYYYFFFAFCNVLRDLNIDFTVVHSDNEIPRIRISWFVSTF